MRSALKIVFVMFAPLSEPTPNVLVVVALWVCDAEIFVGFCFAVEVETLADAVGDDYPFTELVCPFNVSGHGCCFPLNSASNSS